MAATNGVARSTVFGAHQSWSTALTDTATTAKEKLGAIRWDDDGRAYTYGNAKVAVALGDALMLGSTTDTISGTPAAAATSITLGTGAYTANQWVGWYVTLETGGGAAGRQGNTYRIVANDAGGAAAGTITIERGLDNAGVSSDQLRFWAPWYFDKLSTGVGLTADVVTGLALGTVAAGSYGWFQIYGMGFAKVRLNTVTPTRTNTASLSPYLQGSATAGVLEAIAITTPTATEAIAIATSRVRSLWSATATTAATQVCPVFINTLNGGN